MFHDANAWLLAPERQPDSNKGTAVITGHGPALPDEHVVRLFKIEDDGLAHVAATNTIANGQFRFDFAYFWCG